MMKCSKRSLDDWLTDDLLATEILPRVADSGTAVRCSAVCKRWRSLIECSDFIRNFRRRHDTARFRPYCMVMDYTYLHDPPFSLYSLGGWSLLVSGSEVSPARPKHNQHCFVGLAIKSTCREFVLFAAEDEDDPPRLCVLNSVTGEALHIPGEPPPPPAVGFMALVGVGHSHSHSTNNTKFDFRIVNIRCWEGRQGWNHYSSVFSSETGLWSDPVLAPGLRYGTDVVASNGLLFWLQFDQLVAFDACSSSWTCVPLPVDLLHPWDSYQGLPVELGSPLEVDNTRPQPRPYEDPLHIAAVQGRLRLEQLFRAGGVTFFIKIWELWDCCDDDDSGKSKSKSKSWSWRLASQVKLSPAPQQADWIYFFAFDAENRDVIFVCCERNVYRYSMVRGRYKRVFKLMCAPLEKRVGVPLDKSIPRFTKVYTLDRPSWHTSLPKLPSLHLNVGV